MTVFKLRTSGVGMTSLPTEPQQLLGCLYLILSLSRCRRIHWSMMAPIQMYIVCRNMCPSKQASSVIVHLIENEITWQQKVVITRHKIMTESKRKESFETLKQSILLSNKEFKELKKIYFMIEIFDNTQLNLSDSATFVKIKCFMYVKFANLST